MFTLEDLSNECHSKMSKEQLKEAGFSEITADDRGVGSGHAGKHYLKKGTPVSRKYFEITDDSGNIITKGYTWSCCGVPLGALRMLGKVAEKLVEKDGKTYLRALVSEDCCIEGILIGNNRYRYEIVK